MNIPLFSFPLQSGQAFCSCPEGLVLDADWKSCIDIDECQLQQTMKPEQRCNYDCINTIGSFKCVDNSEIGADQPADFDDYAMKNEVDSDTRDSYDADGNYDIIEGGSFVSECSNGYYFNETMGDCQGTKFAVINFHNNDNDDDVRRGWGGLGGGMMSLNPSHYLLCAGSGAHMKGETWLREKRRKLMISPFFFFPLFSTRHSRMGADINECEIDNGNCSNGTCVNTNGSFYCSCHKGLVMSEDDRYKCVRK